MFLEILKDFFAHIFFLCCFVSMVWAVVMWILDRKKPFNFDEVIERNIKYDLMRVKVSNELMQAELRATESALVNRFDYESECQ